MLKIPFHALNVSTRHSFTSLTYCYLKHHPKGHVKLVKENPYNPGQDFSIVIHYEKTNHL